MNDDPSIAVFGQEICKSRLLFDIIGGACTTLYVVSMKNKHALSLSSQVALSALL